MKRFLLFFILPLLLSAQPASRISKQDTLRAYLADTIYVKNRFRVNSIARFDSTVTIKGFQVDSSTVLTRGTDQVVTGTKYITPRWYFNSIGTDSINSRSNSFIYLNPNSTRGILAGSEMTAENISYVNLFGTKIHALSHTIGGFVYANSKDSLRIGHATVSGGVPFVAIATENSSSPGLTSAMVGFKSDAKDTSSFWFQLYNGQASTSLGNSTTSFQLVKFKGEGGSASYYRADGSRYLVFDRIDTSNNRYFNDAKSSDFNYGNLYLSNGNFIVTNGTGTIGSTFSAGSGSSGLSHQLSSSSAVGTTLYRGTSSQDAAAYLGFATNNSSSSRTLVAQIGGAMQKNTAGIESGELIMGTRRAGTMYNGVKIDSNQSLALIYPATGVNGNPTSTSRFTIVGRNNQLYLIRGYSGGGGGSATERFNVDSLGFAFFSAMKGTDSIYTTSATSMIHPDGSATSPRLGLVKASGFGPELRFLSSSASTFSIRRVTAGTILAPTASTVDMQIGATGNVTWSGGNHTGMGTITSDAVFHTSTTISEITRQTANTTTPAAAFRFREQSTGTMGSGFGGYLAFFHKDNTGTDNDMADIYVVQTGGTKNSAKFDFYTTKSGASGLRMTIDSNYVNFQSLSLMMGGTEWIDASRNMSNIASLSVIGNVTASGIPSDSTGLPTGGLYFKASDGTVRRKY